MCEGSLIPAWAAHAVARDTGGGDDLAAAADRFESLQMFLFAAEAATEAAHAFQREGDQRAAAAQRARASAFAQACESPNTPALVTADVVVPLTAREREICALAAKGATSPEIATALFLSVRTVNNHLQRAYTKLGVTNRRELADALHNAVPHSQPDT
jgi:DNA-binding CsgD family transcriptional regulator